MGTQSYLVHAKEICSHVINKVLPIIADLKKMVRFVHPWTVFDNGRPSKVFLEKKSVLFRSDLIAII